MKTSITFLLFLTFFNTLISQNKLQEIEEAFNTEIYNFNNRVLNTYDGGIEAYEKLYSILDNGESRILKSQGEYSKLTPGWFGTALKVADKLAPGSEKIGKFATTLLEIGWKEHNDEIEAFRKKTALDGQIEVKKLVNNWKAEFDIRLSRFIPNRNEVSKFERRNKIIFNNGTLKEKEQILKELQEYNKELVKDYPVFAEENNAKAKKIAQIGVYEAYINHFTVPLGANVVSGEEGYLMGYLNYDENSKLISKVIIPKVPSGIEVGNELNKLILGINIRPLDLNVYKIILVYINGKRAFYLTVFQDNFIGFSINNKNNKNNNYCNRYNQSLTDTQKNYLRNYGGSFDSKADENCLPEPYFSIKKSLFKEFAERNSSNIKKLPKTLKKLIDF